jgi:hypothetical protein
LHYLSLFFYVFHLVFLQHLATYLVALFRVLISDGPFIPSLKKNGDEDITAIGGKNKFKVWQRSCDGQQGNCDARESILTELRHTFAS